MVELQNEDKLNEIIDKKIGDEIDGSTISDVFDGYKFKITGGFDKDGFAMKNGILSQGKKKVLLTKGCSLFRFRKGYHRTGIRIRRLVRGCIVSHDIKNLHLKIIKKGPKEIEGLTTAKDAQPKRLGPKRATKILKEFGLLQTYTEKKKNKEEQKNLRFMITKFAPKRSVKTKNGKEYVKRPKIQRLITPDRLRRKRLLKRFHEERKMFEDIKHKIDGLMKNILNLIDNSVIRCHKYTDNKQKYIEEMAQNKLVEISEKNMDFRTQVLTNLNNMNQQIKNFEKQIQDLVVLKSTVKSEIDDFLNDFYQKCKKEEKNLKIYLGNFNKIKTEITQMYTEVKSNKKETQTQIKQNKYFKRKSTKIITTINRPYKDRLDLNTDNSKNIIEEINENKFNSI